MALLLPAIIMILALLAIRFSNRHGIPSLLLFFLLGIGFTTFGVEFHDFDLVEDVSTLALMVIMFYGGFGTNVKMGKPVLKQSIILSSLGVVFTAVATGLFAHYALGFPLIEGLLLGSVVGSTDYASVSSILQSKNLNLKYNTAPILELESGSNDPTAYTMTMIFLSLLLGGEISVPLLVAKQLFFAVGFGAGMGFIFVKIIQKIDFSQEGLFSVFVSAMAIATYALAVIFEGNGFLAIYLFGIIIGSYEYKGKRETVFFFDGLTEMMQIGLFFLLGLLSEIDLLIKAMPIALIIMVVMTLVIRPLAVVLLMKPFGAKNNQILTLSLAGLRGAAAIAFAIMVINSRVRLTMDIYHIVFGICILSSLIQGSLMPSLVRKWDMLDPNDTVLKTFNYYQDKSDIGFIQTRIHNDNLYGTKVKDLNLTFDFIVAKMIRNGKTIVPHGNTEILEGDIIIIGGETYFDSLGDELLEFTINPGNPWIDKSIRDLGLTSSQLILMIQRGKEIVVPTGNTVIQEGDKVLYTKEKEELFSEI
ncbi:potassium/proton antiporter [Peptoniphilus sp. KCTC 25270]|uniref:potassium/proton antiporter n=1 Tax=Peptoniphilus sp. KCTC 25270 TaxID=2897414 RepID=UPI001E3610E3|nr:potassium/proton antiporter [Peptoniphilus sp. KCTC 25270]MCD1147427.1 potassium/proton antiporter [Peptoniphilus sp. KCTC 25270]